ncbi:MAG: Mrp/NBP35 family ATP-binding protein [Ruminococcaceae bacterium]|nr:Mrp/NBP35 family ATP-binding protein [Oscillospiraceae bacterium]
MAEERKCNQEGCSGDCSSCSKADGGIPKEPGNQYSTVKKVIGIVSGKGGVGKSLVCGMMATLMNRRGKSVGIMDADITGPSIPKMFGIGSRAYQNELGLLPATTGSDIRIMSINLLLENEDSPVVWRGPVIGGVVKQFWNDVVWGDCDYMFIDMPPGTGDVPLTVYQSLPLDGIIIVTSPQDLVSLIVKKAYNMASLMNVPVLGIVENMSYVVCPDCERKFRIFGDGKSQTVADELGVPLLGEIPIDPQFATLCDAGKIERFSGDFLDKAADLIENL